MIEHYGRIQRRQETTGLPTMITGPGISAVVTGPLITAAPPSSSTVSVYSYASGVQTKTIINPSDSTAITSATHSQASGASRTTASSSASATSGASSPNPSTLIPAIVAPVAAVLLISFIAFWWFMRRRTKKALKREPDFVMEGMKEKPRNRPATSDSNSSTQELVPTKNKEMAVNVREVERPVPNSSAFSRETNFAPPRLESAMDSRPGSRQTDQAGRSKAIPNFSRGPRSSNLSRDATSSPAAGFLQSDRGGSRTGHYSPPSGGSGQRSNNVSRGPDRIDPPPPVVSKPTQPHQGSFSRPLGPLIGVSRAPPASISLRPDGSNQNSNSLPAGAYNGSSPISQYSPIVKDMPKFGTSPMPPKQNMVPRGPNGSLSSINDQGIRKPPPSAIKTGSSPLSPSDPSFSDENMRVARLANNSRLKFHSLVATTAATSPATEEPPTPSPRLPPPATRDAPPTNYNIPLPTHEPPTPASIQARLNGASISDRRSVVSGLSDDYVDMEVDDNKSDVSSLDEREKWQMQSDTSNIQSRQAGLGGYGGLGPRPPLLSVNSHNSDASGSQYSLGYYTKEDDKGYSR